MNGCPKVSVYLPTHRRPRLLARAVDSVLGQSYPDIELILSLDRPDAQTQQVAAEARMGKVRSVRVLESPAPGACAARNAAIACAAGTLITGLDDDDYLEPGHVSALVAAFDPARHAFAFSGFRTRLTHGAAAASDELSRLPGKDVGLSDLLRSNLVGNQVLTLTARMREIGGFDEELPAWQDYDLWLRLARRYGAGKNVAAHSYVLDQVSAHDRISADPARLDAAFQRFLQKHAEYRKPLFYSYLRLTRAAYGGAFLRMRDVVRIVLLDRFPTLSGFALNCYFRILRERSASTAAGYRSR